MACVYKFCTFHNLDLWSDFALEFKILMFFILLLGAQQGILLVAPRSKAECPPLTPSLRRLQTARDATPAPGGSGRLQGGATATPTPSQPRWARMDTRGLMATPMDTQEDTPPAQLSTMDIITAGRDPPTTSSLEQTKDSSTSDEEHPEPKT